MTGVIPAFWAKYRGTVDPNRPDLTTEYVYKAYFWYGTKAVQFQTATFDYTLTFTVLGPPQLTKERFIELKWTVPPGLVAIQIDIAGDTRYYSSNAAEGGTRDEGRYNILGTGVLQQ